jgi:osmotically-inducible protein OsmY
MRAVIGTVVCAAALLVAGSMPAQAAVPQAAAKSSDSTIDARISQRLKADAVLKKYPIHVSVEDGVAKLTGTVPTEADRSKAAELAKVNGVMRVDNQILVDVNAGTTTGTAGTIKEKTKEGAEKTKEGAEKAWDKTKEGSEKAYEKTKAGAQTVGEKTKAGAKKVGEKTKEGLSKTGEVITDTWITTKIKADMVNEDLLKDSDVHVTTNNHVVTLSGTVLTATGRARAATIAKGTDGVKRVLNRITIGPKK